MSSQKSLLNFDRASDGEIQNLNSSKKQFKMNIQM